MFSPFAHYGIDEKSARIVNVLVGTLALALLVLDVSARAFSRPGLSLFTNVSRKILWFFSIPPRRVDAAPKRFAARIGLILIAVMVLADATESRRLLLITSMVLALLALLEAGINFSAAGWAWVHLHPRQDIRSNRSGLRAG